VLVVERHLRKIRSSAARSLCLSGCNAMRLALRQAPKGPLPVQGLVLSKQMLLVPKGKGKDTRAVQAWKRAKKGCCVAALISPKS